MPFLGGFVFPHGAITLNPATRDLSKEPAYLPTTKDNCLMLHAAMKSQAETLVRLKPDLIIMTTPHGIRLNSSYVFLGNDKASGNASWNGQWTEFTASIKANGELSNAIVTKLSKSGNSVELIQVGDASEDALPLRWAEVIPWWFIAQAANEAGFIPPSALILGMPMKRYIDSKGMIPELLKLGSDLWHCIKEDLFDKRVAVVTSCDLSHCHSKDPTSPYPYHEDASTFDNFCVEWSKIDIDTTQANPGSESNQKLLKNAGDVVNPILSCGFTGLVLLQGILTACVSDSNISNPSVVSRFKADSLAYSWPTYYGMMVCNFTAVSESDLDIETEALGYEYI